MYFAVFVKQVWMPGENLPRQFYRNATLPFVPFIGLQIAIPEGHFGPVTWVKWFENKRAFFLGVEDDSEMLGDVPEWKRISKELKTDFLETKGWVSFNADERPDFWFSGGGPGLEKISVYYFTCYDVQTDQVVRSKRPATREVIARCNGAVIEETVQEVEVAQLDDDGFLAR